MINKNIIFLKIFINNIMENKKIYDIELIIKKCDSIENKKEFINYISQILEEKQNSFLFQLYSIMKKDFIIKTLQKTLKIMNEGGISKIESNSDIRTVGGTFIHLVKTSDLLSKDLLKKIFWRNKKKKEMKKKLCRALKKLNIDNNENDKENPKQKTNQK